MVRGGLGKSGRRNGKAPIELGDEYSPPPSQDAVITLSDSDSVESIDVVQSRGDAELKLPTIDLISERRNRQVHEKELSRLHSIFPNANPLVAATDLASQLMKTSPGKALERIIHRYVEHGEPKAEQGPHEGPKPDPPQVIEKPTDAFARPSVHGVGTSNHEERQVDCGYELLPPEITANYNLWTYYTLAKEFPRYPIWELRRVLEENNCWFAPSYKAISSDYAAALAVELRGQGRKRERRHGYLKLLKRPRPGPRVSKIKPREPCYIFERELQSIQKALADNTN